MRDNKLTWRNWAKAALLLVPLLLLTLAQPAPNFIERFYSEGLYKGVSSILHFLFSWVPFSIGDIFYIAVIVSSVIAVIVTIRAAIRKNFWLAGKTLFRLVISTELLIIVFYLFWGLNYSRPPAAELLSLQDTSYTLSDVKNVTGMIIDSVNKTRSRINIADLETSDDSIYTTSAEAIRNIAPISSKFKVYLPAVKSSLLSPLLNYMGTSGYFNPFTGEAQVNRLMPVFDKPFTACHEMSHQMGFGREDEANFVGYLAGVNSKNELLKYSAYYEATIEFLRYLHRRDTTSYKLLKSMLSDAVKHDLKTDSLYWTRYSGPLGDMSGRFYDSFLKANKQPAGLRTYNRMIRLTMSWYKKRGIY
ncbi:DUF3810 domain-containing protein [Mucilaginibacter ginkgonis]|uniref:DUF3810 domain-containing protein n=1 Tax=Mucilaginibacter ginkgonis TaxID=2682091 RepID=A0A6I4I1B8_9SPHI|nr:DUF3810 domain-containing protein [Mucilaginibacter ginkgonis]QQL48917.1 DUF3810 domain-containing protein [Mucilaginibacter ginkgonis]